MPWLSPLRRLEAWRQHRDFRRRLQAFISQHGRIADGGADFSVVLQRIGFPNAHSTPELYWLLFAAWVAVVKGEEPDAQVMRILRQRLPAERLAAVLAIYAEDRGLGRPLSEQRSHSGK